MAVYWSLELLPLPVTSLLPVILFPLLGVMDTNTTAMVYMKGVQMMYMGSLMVALAVEESGLHRRIALTALSMTVHTNRTLFIKKNPNQATQLNSTKNKHQPNPNLN